MILQSQHLHKVCCPMCFLHNKADSAAVRTLGATARLISRSVAYGPFTVKQEESEEWEFIWSSHEAKPVDDSLRFSELKKRPILNCFALRIHPVAMCVLNQDYSYACYFIVRSWSLTGTVGKKSAVYLLVQVICTACTHHHHVTSDSWFETRSQIFLASKVHPKTGHEGPEGEQMYSSTLNSTSALDGVGGQRLAPAALPPGEDLVPIV